MSFFDLIKNRYSVRSFEPREVEKEKIEKVLEAARLSPSAVNYQPRHFVVVTDEGLKAEVCQAYSEDWLQKAPVLIVALGNHEQSWKRRGSKDHCDIDVAIAVDHLTLAATSLGLGTCWVCAFDPSKVQQALDLPDHLEPTVLIPLGYPSEAGAPRKKRKSLEELVSWNGLNI